MAQLSTIVSSSLIDSLQKNATYSNFSSRTSVHMASDSQAANDNDASGSCYMCAKSISAKNTAVILCCPCNNLCHASCLANGFVAKYGGTKPAQQWLVDFVREENLFHICKTCKDGGVRPSVGSLPTNTTGAPSNQVQQLDNVNAVISQQDDVRKLRAEYVALQTSVCTMAGTLDGISKQWDSSTKREPTCHPIHDPTETV
jgi:hypothetical protein